MDLFNSIDDLVGGTPVFKVCDNCVNPLDEYENHRCRADIDSCIDGINCPDYVKVCDCGCRTIDG